MQRCEYGERMSLHLDGLLSMEETVELQSHLARCEECRIEWEALCWLSSRLKQEPAATPPPDFTRQVTARIQQRETRRRRIRSSIGVLLGSLGLWASVGLMLLVLFVLLWQPSLRLLLFEVGLPLLKHILSTVVVLGRAYGSVVQTLASQPLPSALFACAALALALTVLWTRVVFRYWGQVPSST